MGKSIKKTPAEALVAIKKAAAEGNIQFACSDKIMQYEAMLHDFMENIMFCFGYALTDLSSIDEWSDPAMETKKELYSAIAKRIKERYQVRMKIGTKNSYYICDILERLSIKIASL